jgi:hypothetical protein
MRTRAGEVGIDRLRRDRNEKMVPVRQLHGLFGGPPVLEATFRPQ